MSLIRLPNTQGVDVGNEFPVGKGGSSSDSAAIGREEKRPLANGEPVANYRKGRRHAALIIG